jgi:hypothetical protein
MLMPLMPMLLNLLVPIPPRMPIGRSAFGNRSGSAPAAGSTRGGAFTAVLRVQTLTSKDYTQSYGLKFCW